MVPHWLRFYGEVLGGDVVYSQKPWRLEHGFIIKDWNIGQWILLIDLSGKRIYAWNFREIWTKYWGLQRNSSFSLWLGFVMVHRNRHGSSQSSWFNHFQMGLPQWNHGHGMPWLSFFTYKRGWFPKSNRLVPETYTIWRDQHGKEGPSTANRHVWLSCRSVFAPQQKMSNQPMDVNPLC